MLQSDPDKSYKIMRNVRFDGMDDIDDPDYGYNKWYTGKIKYKEFNEDWDEDTFVFKYMMKMVTILQVGKIHI